MHNFKQRLRHISCFVLDVDGVLTDGGLFVSESGALMRVMNIKDGYAIRRAVDAGYRVAVISGGRSAGVPERMQRLGVTDVFMEVKDKKETLESYLSEKKIKPETVLYLGDDLPDREAMRLCGLAACPADAAFEIRDLCHYVSEQRGGEGCVRDVIEQALRLHGKWD